jgi:cytochrome bd-type quinol oxidase subunit 2
LEGAVKYLIATVALVFSLVLGWFVSAKYLEPLILSVFNPESHEKYLDIWFVVFVSIELVVVLMYTVYIYTVYKNKMHLTKSSSGR